MDFKKSLRKTLFFQMIVFQNNTSIRIQYLQNAPSGWRGMVGAFQLDGKFAPDRGVSLVGGHPGVPPEPRGSSEWSDPSVSSAGPKAQREDSRIGDREAPARKSVEGGHTERRRALAREEGSRTNVHHPHLLTPVSPPLCVNTRAENLRTREDFFLQVSPDGTILSPTGLQKQDTSETRQTCCVDDNILFI